MTKSSRNVALAIAVAAMQATPQMLRRVEQKELDLQKEARIVREPQPISVDLDVTKGGES